MAEVIKLQTRQPAECLTSKYVLMKPLALSRLLGEYACFLRSPCSRDGIFFPEPWGDRAQSKPVLMLLRPPTRISVTGSDRSVLSLHNLHENYRNLFALVFVARGMLATGSAGFVFGTCRLAGCPSLSAARCLRSRNLRIDQGPDLSACPPARRS